MIKTKVAFLEGRLFSSQSELFEYFLSFCDWPDKSRPSKKPQLFWSCKQAKCGVTAQSIGSGAFGKLILHGC